MLQLDALMAVAHDIPALHRMEHPGDTASNLGADDFLPIFIYVLVNSRVEDLAVQSLVLETLCDPKKMMGEAGRSRLSGTRPGCVHQSYFPRLKCAHSSDHLCLPACLCVSRYTSRSKLLSVLGMYGSIPVGQSWVDSLIPSAISLASPLPRALPPHSSLIAHAIPMHCRSIANRVLRRDVLGGVAAPQPPGGRPNTQEIVFEVFLSL